MTPPRAEMMNVSQRRRLFRYPLVFPVVALVIAAGCEAPRSGAPEFEYVNDPGARVVLNHDGAFYVGTLDSAGSFVPRTGSKGYRAYSGPEIDINRRRWPGEPIYEFRSGVLIKGTFDDTLNFIPEVGSEVIPFEDYKYSKDAPRIYNLPGRFVEKKK